MSSEVFYVPVATKMGELKFRFQKIAAPDGFVIYIEVVDPTSVTHHFYMEKNRKSPAREWHIGEDQFTPKVPAWIKELEPELKALLNEKYKSPSR